MISKKWTDCATRVAIAALVLTATPAVSRAGEFQCVSSEESEAFQLRQLQSRLMVAALSCNQTVAYNDFVEHYKLRLAAAGISMKSYFQRIGGGEKALNQHITTLANVAGLSRASEPENFCGETWTMFLLLEDEEEELPIVAARHLLQDAPHPQECRILDAEGDRLSPRVTTPLDLPPIIKASAP